MTKLKNITIGVSGRPIRVNPEYFTQMYTIKQSSDPINNGRLFERIGNMWADNLSGTLEPQISELYLDNQSLFSIDTRQKLIREVGESELLEIDIEEICVQRGIGKIIVPGISEFSSPAVAINFHENGDELAFGSDISICSNMTIFSGTNLFSTYDKIRGAGGNYTKLSLDNIFGILRQYFEQTEKRFHKEQEQIAELKEQYISRDEFNRFVGEIFCKIQEVNHFKLNRRSKELSQKYLPVSGIQLSRIAVEACHPSHEVYDWDQNKTSLWNVVNYGTETLKFERGSNGPTVLKANKNWVELVMNYSFI